MNESEKIVNLINAQEVIISAGALVVQLSKIGEIGNEMCQLDFAGKTPTKEQLKEWIETIAVVVDWGIESLPSEAKEYIKRSVENRVNENL